MTKSFNEFHEAIQPWLLDGKYRQALEKLQGSVYFRNQPMPKDMNLSIGQLQRVFGNEFESLMKMGIIRRKPSGNNPFGADSPSYELINPV